MSKRIKLSKKKETPPALTAALAALTNINSEADYVTAAKTNYVPDYLKPKGRMNPEMELNSNLFHNDSLIKHIHTLNNIITQQDIIISELSNNTNTNFNTAPLITIGTQTSSSDSISISTQTSAAPAIANPISISTQTSAPIASYSSVTASNLPATPTFSTAPRKPKAPLSDRKRLATARAFDPPKPASSPSGFEYIYISRNRNITRKDIRHRLSLLGVTTSRIIDIIFPANNIVGILIHQDYKPDFMTVLDKCKISTIDSFDPTAPQHICDPKYQNLNDSQRADLSLKIHQDRCLRTLHFIRPYLVPSVAKFFAHQNWVSSELASGVIQSRAPAPRFSASSASSKRTLPSTYASAADAFLQTLDISIQPMDQS